MSDREEALYKVAIRYAVLLDPGTDPVEVAKEINDGVGLGLNRVEIYCVCVEIGICCQLPRTG